MPSDDLQAQVTDLRNAEASLKRRLERKEKRLAKTSQKVAEFEALLLQSESDIESLRSKISASENRLQEAAQNAERRIAGIQKEHVTSIAQLQARICEGEEQLKNSISSAEAESLKTTIRENDAAVSKLAEELDRFRAIAANVEKLQDSCDELRKQAGEKDALLKERESSVSESEAKLAEATALAEKRAELLETSLADKDSEIGRLQAEVEARQRDIADNISKSKSEHEETLASLAEKEMLLSQIQEQLTLRDEQVSKRDAELKQLQDEVRESRRAEEALAETKREVESKEAAIKEKDDFLLQVQAKLTEAEKTSEEALAETKRDLESKKAVIEEKDGLLEKVLVKLAEAEKVSEKTLSETKEELESKEAAIKEKDALLQQAQAKFAEAEKISEQTLFETKQELESKNTAIKEKDGLLEQVHVKLAEAEKVSAEVAATLQAKETDFKSDSEEKDKRIAQLSEALEILRKSQEEQIETLEGQKAVYEEGARSKEESLSKLRAERDAEIMELKDTLSSAREDGEALRRTIQEHEALIEDLRAKSDAAAAEHRKLEAGHSHIELDLKQNNAKLQSELSEKVSEFESSSRRITELQEQVRDQTASTEKLQTTLEAKCSQYETLQSDFSSLKVKFEDDSNVLGEVRTQLEDAKSQLKASEQEEEDLRLRLVEVNNQHAEKVQKLQESLVFHETELFDTKAQLQKNELAHSDKLSSLRSEVTEKENLIEGERRSSEDLQKKVNELETLLSATKEDVQASLEGSKAALEENENHVQNLQKQLEAAHKQTSELQARVEATEKEVATVVTSLEDMTRERNEITASLDELRISSTKAVSEAQSDAANVIAELATSKEDLEAEVAKLMCAYEESKRSEELVSQQVEALKVSVTSKQSEITLLSDQNSKMLEQIDSLQKENIAVMDTLKVSDDLVAAARESSAKAVSLLQEQHSIKLEAIEKKLTQSLTSEETVVSALTSLGRRLGDLVSSCGLNVKTSEGDEDSPVSSSTLLLQANNMIVSLEECIASGKHLEGEVKDLRSNKESFASELKALREANDDLQKSMEDAKREIAEKSEKLKVFAETQRKVDVVVAGYKEMSEIAADRLEEQEKATEVTLASLQETQEQLEADLLRVTNDYNEAQENNSCLKEAIAEKASQIGEMDLLLQTHKRDAEEMASSIAELEQQKAGIEQQLLASNESAEAQVQRLSAMTQRLADIEQKYILLQNEKEQALDRARSLGESIEELNQEKTKLKESLDKAASEADSNKSGEVLAQAENEALKEQLARRKAEFDDASSEVVSLRKTVSCLESEVEGVKENEKVTLSSLRGELESAHQAEIASLQDNFKCNMKEISDQAEERAELLRTECTKLESEVENREDELSALREEFATSQSTTEKKVKDFEIKLGIAIDANQAAQKRIEALQLSVHDEKAASESLNVELEALSAELDSRSQSEKTLAEQLHKAENAINALEKRITGLRQDDEATRQEHQTEMDTLAQRSESLKEEVADVTKSYREAIELSAKRLHEIERLENSVVPSLRTESEKATQDVYRLEETLEETYQELGSIKAERLDLQEQLGVLGRASEARIAQAGESLRAREEQVESLRREIASTNERLSGVMNDVETKCAEVEALTAQTHSLEEQLKEKETVASKAEAKVSELSEKCAEFQREADEKGDGEVSATLRGEFERIGERNERLSARTSKMQRKLRRLEKLLTLEKKKSGTAAISARNRMAAEMANKRLVSPSTKGMSPSVKRVREEDRKPLSPITSNSKPPPVPRSATLATKLKF